MSNLSIVLVSAAALIDGQGRILLAQRPEGKSMAGLWEFPGGKVKPGETPERALVRELKEELGLGTRENSFIPASFASHAYKDFHLFMPLFLCRDWEGIPEPMEGQAIGWVGMNDLADYPMPPADVNLVADLKRILAA